MTETPWFLQGRWVEYCSCDPGCPCEAMAPPTRGHCNGVVAMMIDEGYFGETRLDDIAVAATFYFPRAIHHGQGHMQPIVQDDTDDAQREALFTILSGEGQPPNTIFNIFSVIIEHHHDPVFAPIEFQWDMHRRRARLKVRGQFEAETTPLRNTVTDEEHRIRTVLPQGWTFYEAEVGAGTAKSVGDIKFDHPRGHSSLAYFAFDNNGMAYSYEDAQRRFSMDRAAVG